MLVVNINLNVNNVTAMYPDTKLSVKHARGICNDRATKTTTQVSHKFSNPSSTLLLIPAYPGPIYARIIKAEDGNEALYQTPTMQTKDAKPLKHSFKYLFLQVL